MNTRRDASADPRRATMFIAQLLAALVTASFLLQVPARADQVPPRLGAAAGDVVRKLAPEEIPRQVIVSMFFVQVVAAAGQLDGPAYEQLLAKLGIPPGSDGDAALKEAARSALKVIDQPEWPEKSLGLDTLAAADFNEAAMLRKANGLAEIYGGLLVRLSSIEGSAERVVAHVEHKRHTITTNRIGEQSAAAIASEEAFSARVREILDAKLPGKFES